MDEYRQITRHGYGSRIGNAFGGVIFGLVLFLAAFIILFVNEGRAVRTAKGLTQGAKAVVSLSSPAPTPAGESHLVHFTGDATGDKLTDRALGVTQTAVHLKRSVEMYQWQETEKTEKRKDTVGGGETTAKTYSYATGWSDKLINSDQFHVKGRYINPDSMRITSKALTAPVVKVGDFTLPEALVDKIDNYTPVPLTKENLAGFSDDFRSDALIADEKCFISGVPGTKPDPAIPSVGDLRISLKAVPPGPVSVVARQVGSTVDSFTTESGLPIFLLYTGAHAAAEMFATEQQNNANLTWILRAAGFLAMFIGVFLILNPLKVMADVIGFIGDLMGMGIGLVAFLVSLVLSSLTIALSWLIFRPMIGILMMAVAVGGVVLIMKFVAKSRATRAARMAPPVPV